MSNIMQIQHDNVWNEEPIEQEPLILDHLKLRDKIWQRYYKNVETKTCNRCGEYLVYDIDEFKKPIKIDKYTGDKKYNELHYTIKAHRVRNQGNVTDPFYHLCNHCINHVRGIETYELPGSNLIKAERQLAWTRNAEQTRRWYQRDEVDAERAAVIKRRKREQEKSIDDYERRQKLAKIIDANNNNSNVHQQAESAANA